MNGKKSGAHLITPPDHYEPARLHLSLSSLLFYSLLTAKFNRMIRDFKQNTMPTTYPPNPSALFEALKISSFKPFVKSPTFCQDFKIPNPRHNTKKYFFIVSIFLTNHLKFILARLCDLDPSLSLWVGPTSFITPTEQVRKNNNNKSDVLEKKRFKRRISPNI